MIEMPNCTPEKTMPLNIHNSSTASGPAGSCVTRCQRFATLNQSIIATKAAEITKPITTWRM